MPLGSINRRTDNGEELGERNSQFKSKILLDIIVKIVMGNNILIVSHKK